MVHSFKDDDDMQYEVYKCSESTPGFRYRKDGRKIIN
jgi:hypothetical protein